MSEPDSSELTPATAEESVDPKSSSTLLIGALGAVITVVIVLALQVLYYRTTEEESLRKAVQLESQELRQVQQAQHQQLDSYRWIDRDAGVAAIPIDRAMQLVVEESAAKR